MSEERCEVTIRIDRKLAGASDAHNKQRIFKVHQKLRSQNEEAYEPQMFSIGPYHRGKSHLVRAEAYKLRYLNDQLARKSGAGNHVGGLSVGNYIQALKRHVQEARLYYSEEDMIGLNGDEFIEMLCVDGCFIVEFLRRFGAAQGAEESVYTPREGDPIFRKEWVIGCVIRDLILFENQLPFFILVELFEMTKLPTSQSQEKSLTGLAILAFDQLFPSENRNSLASIAKDDDKIVHFLDLIHKKWCSAFFDKVNAKNDQGEEENAGSNDAEIEGEGENARRKDSEIEGEGENGLNDAEIEGEGENARRNDSEIEGEGENGLNDAEIEGEGENARRNDAEIEGEGENGRNDTEIGGEGENARRNDAEIEGKGENTRLSSAIEHIKSATELRRTGIKFERASPGTSWLDITYQNGIIKIPSLHVHNWTGCIFRNLIAYEQYILQPMDRKRVVDYITFMDCLIDSSKDVEMLRHRQIISKWLGDDEAVSSLINTLVNEATIDNYRFCYLEVFKQVNEYSSRRWNMWRAHLMRNYFNNPWSIISFVAALFLLLFTATQALFSVLQYFK